MEIFITGVAGFVGSSLAISFKKHYPSYEIYVLDNFKRRGSELNVKRLKTADIDATAEASVLAGLDGLSDYLRNTNLVGTINCINFAPKHNARFVFLSISRIYPIKWLKKLLYKEEETRFTLTDEQSFLGSSVKGINEDFPLDGASKLASELIIQEFNEFQNLKTVINRCGVVTCPQKMSKIDQGIVALWMIKHFYQQELTYIGFHGTGKQTRDTLHIEEINGRIFNVGGGLEISTSLSELTKICQEVTGEIIPIKSISEDRIADIPLYITDNTKVTNLTGWKPIISLRQIVEEVYEWLREDGEQLSYVLE